MTRLRIDNDIEFGTITIDVSEFSPSNYAPVIAEKVAEINQGRRGRGLPEIEYDLIEVENDETAILEVREIPLGIGS